MARGALELLSEALGVDEATKNAFVKSFMSGWKEVLNNVSMPDIVELAIDALASYVGIHVNEFEGLREDDDKHLPQSWSGATARTDGIDTIAFVQRAFDAAMKDAGLDKDQTLSALVSAGVVIMPSQNRRGLKRVVMICNHPTPCICIRTDKFPALDDDFYSRNNIKF
jgi:hypothetical protein